MFAPTDIAPLVMFRICFYLGVMSELIGDFTVGWIQENYGQSVMHFPFIGLEWIQPLPSTWGMYIYYIVLIVLAVCLCIGFFYRISAILFFLGFTYAFLIEKSYYLNHGYLICVLSFWLIWLPANKAFSLDVLQKRVNFRQWTYNWHIYLLIFHMAIVYFFGGLAKMNPDWLQAKPVIYWLEAKRHYPIYGEFISQDWFAYFIAYGGVIFDTTIAFFLLYKPTRLLAFIAVLFFHITNTFLFGIGSFPFLSIALSLLFFAPYFPRKFLKDYTKFKIPDLQPLPPFKQPVYSRILLVILALYIGINAWLPMRHHFFEDRVSWTEEGHKFAWRMMLRSKKARISFRVEDKNSKQLWSVNLNDYLTKRQLRKLKTHPDMIWQFAQHLKKEYAQKGYEVSVFANSWAGLNGRKMQPYIDPNTDLAAVKWQPLQHADWILPLKESPYK